MIIINCDCCGLPAKHSYIPHDEHSFTNVDYKGKSIKIKITTSIIYDNSTNYSILCERCAKEAIKSLKF